MSRKFANGIYLGTMRSSTLRWLVLFATFLITLIVGIQLFWLNKVYSFEAKTFNINVVKSIRGLYEDLGIANTFYRPLKDLIEHPASDYFLFKTDSAVVPDSVSYYLELELNDFDVLTDAYIGFYTAGANRYQSEKYITGVASRYTREDIHLPVYKKDYSYVLLYFPHRNKYILSQMNFWFISSAALFVVLIGLAVILFFFYRQKFLAEIQKDFVNNFTHEFKTPLAVMKISADVLLQDKIITQPERLHKYASIIQTQTNHLQEQVQRLLHIAAVNRRELPIERKSTNVKEIVEQAVAKVQPLAEEKHARIEIQPADDANMELFADHTHLELAIVNLLENALKYAAKPYVVISTGYEDGYVFISIKDNGIGIEKQFHKDLFKKFYRVPTGDVHNVKGFGLGLNFVKRIIDAHRGSIKVNSLPGIGTEFRLLLPHS
jgi:two-component system, OmpR family, phosphate regulon sensor histidine kinase PhoR